MNVHRTVVTAVAALDALQEDTCYSAPRHTASWQPPKATPSGPTLAFGMQPCPFQEVPTQKLSPAETRIYLQCRACYRQHCRAPCCAGTWHRSPKFSWPFSTHPSSVQASPCKGLALLSLSRCFSGQSPEKDCCPTIKETLQHMVGPTMRVCHIA